MWEPTPRAELLTVAQACGLGLHGLKVTAAPKLDPSMTNWTVPVGAVEPDAGATVAVKVTDWPYADGFADEVTAVAVPETAATVKVLVSQTFLPPLVLQFDASQALIVQVPAGLEAVSVNISVSMLSPVMVIGCVAVGVMAPGANHTIFRLVEAPLPVVLTAVLAQTVSPCMKDV